MILERLSASLAQGAKRTGVLSSQDQADTGARDGKMMLRPQVSVRIPAQKALRCRLWTPVLALTPETQHSQNQNAINRAWGLEVKEARVVLAFVLSAALQAGPSQEAFQGRGT